MKFLDVIKYEGPANSLIWKHPAEDFNTGSSLTVHESQEAIFIKDGQIADIFTAGKYVLETKNLPILNKFVNFPTGGVSPFHCEVYFVNKAESLGIKWGTDSKVQFIEPNYQFPMEIGACGEMSLRISDTAGFLKRVVGTEAVLTAEGLVRSFKAMLMTRVKPYLVRTIKEKQLNIFEIDGELDLLSDGIKEKLVADFADYGVELQQFFISNVLRPVDDPNYIRLKRAQADRFNNIFEQQTLQQEKLIQQQTIDQTRIMDAQSMAEKRRLEGYTYQDERSFDVAERVASNESAGQFANMGVGLGVMAGVGGVMGGAVGNMVGGAMNSVPQAPAAPAPQAPAAAPAGGTKICACGAEIPAGAKFCMECGAKQPVTCPNCGTQLTDGAKFCLECGTKL